MLVFTDRSRTEDYHRCPRKRWWNYEVLRGELLGPNGAPHVGGIVSLKTSRDLLIGICWHLALAHMLQNGPESVEEATRLALEEHRKQAEDGLAYSNSDPDNYRYFVEEGEALTEGLVRAAGIRLVPGLLARFEILDVEREERLELTPGLIFQARADAVGRDRETEELVVVSGKTKGRWSGQEEKEARHDMQGISEAVVVEARRREPVLAVQMAVAVKGQKYEDKSRPGKWVVHNVLTRAWRKDEIDSSLDQWAWSYETQKINKKTGETYMGRLGQEWRAVHVWEEYPGGVKAWVEDLAIGKWQRESGDPFASLFVLPEPWGRSLAEMGDWREEVTAQELRVAGDAKEARALAREHGPVSRELRSCLNQKFPRHRRACMDYGGCPYEGGLCFAGDVVVENPLANGFRLRVPHHEQEGKA
jgi:hypothetical protein